MSSVAHITERNTNRALVLAAPNAIIDTLKIRLNSIEYRVVHSTEELEGLFENRLLDYEVVVIGSSICDPVKLARRVHNYDKTISVIVLSTQDQYDELRREIIFSPISGSEVTLWSVEDSEELPSSIVAAAERCEQRRKYLSVVSSVHVRLGNMSLCYPDITHYLDHLLDSLPIGVLTVDNRGILLSINNEASRILCISIEEALGSNITQLVPTNESAQLKSIIESRLDSNESTTSTVIQIHDQSSNTNRHIELATSPLSYSAGPASIIITLHDITQRERAEQERKEAEKELRQQASLLRSFYDITSTQDLLLEEKYKKLLQTYCNLFQLSLGVIIRFDQDILHILASTEVDGIYATGNKLDPNEKLFALDINTDLPPDTVSQVNMESNTGLLSQRARLDSYIRMRITVSGETFGVVFFQTNRKRLKQFSRSEKEIMKLIAQWIGHEELRRAQEEQSRMLSSALEQTADPVMITDRHRIIKYVNHAFERLTGYKKEEVLECNPKFLRAGVLHQSFYDELYKTISAGKIYRGEVINKKKDGTIYYEKRTVTPLRDEAGEITHYISSGHDITEKKKAEEAERRHREELAHVARLNTLGELSSGIAHELSQPLCAINLYSQACLREIDNSDLPVTDQFRSGLGEIVKQAQMASTVFKRLRAFSRKSTPSSNCFCIKDVVNEVFELLKPELARHEIQTIISLHDENRQVTADFIQIEQVIINLVKNSIDSIVSNASSFKKLFMTSRSDTDHHIEVCIRDTGAGCPEEIREQLFDPFFTNKQDGLGIGLSISRTIIESHGGTIWLKDNCPQGATFCFTLPTRATDNE